MTKRRQQPPINTLYVHDDIDPVEPFVARTACVRIGQCPHCGRDVKKYPDQIPPKADMAAGDMNCDDCGGHIYFVTEMGQAGLTLGTWQTVGKRFNEIRNLVLESVRAQSIAAIPTTTSARPAKRSIWGDTSQRIGERHRCKNCGYEFTIRSGKSRCPKCPLFVDSEGWAILFVVFVIAFLLLCAWLGIRINL